jgi:bifunctional DNA-binding transcriptional regulator/antitoxin component of YhaV-PrlF toxin-antitoxin module
MMASTVDDQGRLYLPKKTRERYGERFRIVELENGIKLVPVDDDPVEGLQRSMAGIQYVPLEDLEENVDEAARDDAVR